MITGEILNKVDALLNAFWTGGISNPLEVIEQITYLLFLNRMDDLLPLEENKSARLKRPLERRIFPEGADPKGRAYDDLRWSRFKHFEAKEMFEVVNDHVFPFLRPLGGDGTTYAHHMNRARCDEARRSLRVAIHLHQSSTSRRCFQLFPSRCIDWGTRRHSNSRSALPSFEAAVYSESFLG